MSQVTVTIGSLNRQDTNTFMITAGSLNSQDMIRILKQSRHDFSGKHLYGGYCMDIMCCLYVHSFENPYKKFSEILPSHSGIIVVLSNE